MPGDASWIQPLLLLIALGTVILLTLKQARELKRLEDSASSERIVTLVRCGDSTREREFKEGDYIGKTVDECNGQGVIVGIYAYRQEKGDKKGRAKPQSPSRSRILGSSRARPFNRFHSTPPGE